MQQNEEATPEVQSSSCAAAQEEEIEDEDSESESEDTDRVFIGSPFHRRNV